MGNLLSATFNVAVYTDEIMEGGTSCGLFAAQSEEQAIDKAYSFKTAYAYKIKLVQHLDHRDETEPKNMFTRLSDGTYLRVDHESPYRYINFDETYSLSEICDRAEKGEFSLSPIAVAKMRGELNAYNFLKEVGLGQGGIEEPRFIIARKVTKWPKAMGQGEDVRLTPIALKKGEIVYDKKRHQIWPKMR